MVKKILIISDAPDAKTGFAKNCKCILDGIKDNPDYEVAVASLTDIKSREEDGYHVFGGRTADGRQDYGKKKIPKIIKKWEPDIVLSIVDLQMVSYLRELKYPSQVQVNIDQPWKSYEPSKVADSVKKQVKSMKNKDSFKWVALVPIDGEPIPLTWHKILKNYVDEVVAMSEYGQTLLKEEVDIDATHIPHGVQLEKFLEADDVSKRDIFTIPDSHFVVGTVNRNQKRKMYPRLIKSFARFYFENDEPNDVHLYMHCDYNDREGWNLVELLANEGLVKNTPDGYKSIRNDHDQPVILPYQGKVEFDRLVDIYNSFDVFFSATGGEGFGLTTIEALASGTPVIITDYTTSEEIINEKNGHLIDVATFYRPVPEFSGCKRALIDIEDATKALNRYYSKYVPTPNNFESSEIRNTIKDKYNWEDIGDRWNSFLSEV